MGEVFTNYTVKVLSTTTETGATVNQTDNISDVGAPTYTIRAVSEDVAADDFFRSRDGSDAKQIKIIRGNSSQRIFNRS